MFSLSSEIIIKIAEGNENLIINDSIIYSKDFKVIYLFPSNIEDILINESVEIIEEYSYYGCKMANLTIPPNVQAIKSYAFSKCHNLKNVEILDFSNLSIIESNAFANCDNLQNFSFLSHSNIKRIEFNTFHNTNISVITIPDYVTFIDKNAFDSSTLIHISNTSHVTNIDFYNKNYSEVIVPSNVIIPSYIFSDSNNLESVVFSKYSILQVIGIAAFNNTQIEEIIIPSSVKKISSSAFSNCIKLTHLLFDENSELEQIGEKAFYNTNISSIHFPSKTFIIDKISFANISNLKKNVIFEKGTNAPILYYNSFNCSIIQFLRISTNFMKIHNEAFSNCVINEMIIDEFIGIDNTIFPYYSNITDILITINNFKTIFCYYPLLNLPKVVTLIFDNIESEVIYISKLNQNIKLNIKNKCKFENLYFYNYYNYYYYYSGSDLTYMGQDNLYLDSSFFVLNPEQTIIYEYLGTDQVLSIRGCEEIAAKAFANLSIKYCYISDYIQTINNKAFYNCSDLIAIYFEDESELSMIGDQAFSCCPNLKFISEFKSENYKCVKDTVYEIKNNEETILFHSPMSEETIFEVNSTIIGEASFVNSFYLQEVYIFQNSVQLIKRYAFFNCTKLQKINFPICVSYVSEFSFLDCNALKGCLYVENRNESYIKMLFDSGIPIDCLNCSNIVLGMTIKYVKQNIGAKGSFISLFCIK